MEKVNVPEGTCGDWKVEKFSISKDDWRVISYGGRAPFPGNYTRLKHNGVVVMSDTDIEQRDHYEALHAAKGHILINGLGLGLFLLNCMKKKTVEKATVVELSKEVIQLVGPTYKKLFGDKVEIINEDAFEYKPPKGIRYGMVWHDIWTYICADNYEGMKKLHRKYGRKTDWQGSWCRHEVYRLVNEDKNRNYWR